MSGYWPSNESASSRLAQNIAPGPQTGGIENFLAAREDQKFNNNPLSMYDNLAEAYAERSQEVYTRTGKKLQNPILSEAPGILKDVVGGGTEFFRQRQIDDFEAEIDRLRVDHPDLTTRDQMNEKLNERAATIEARAADVSERAGLLGKVGGLAGMMEGAIEDPAILVTLPFGAAKGAGILKTAITEALVAGGTEAAAQPQIQIGRRKKSLEGGVAQGALNVATATGGGFVLGGAIKGAERLIGRKLLNKFDSTVKKPSAEQKTARDLYERTVEISETNPLDSTLPGAQAEHTDRLSQAMKALDETAAPADLPPPVSPLSAQKLSEGPGNLDGVIWSFNPAEIKTDARTFQFKEGGNVAGVTDRLRGVTQWDPVKAGSVLVYENAKGERFIADGHQRLGLAKRIAAESPDQNVSLYGQLFREQDGFSPETVRVIAAMKNIAEGTGTAIDAAKVLRVFPERIRELPPGSALVRQASDMVSLSDEAFGMVVNEIVPAHFAAIVGRMLPDQPDFQMAVLDVLAKTEPVNVTQAEAIVRQAIEAGRSTETQIGLFGEETITTSLFSERAKVLDKGLKKLRQDAKVFDTLVRNEDRIASEGNILQRGANEARAQTDARAAQMIQTLASRKGPLSDALTNAARRAADEKNFTKATADFIDAVRSAIERGDFDGLPGGGDGRASEIANENPARAGGAAESAIDEQSLALFDEPAGRGAEQQAKGLDNAAREDYVTDDILNERIPVGETVDPETGARIPQTKSINDILDELDRDQLDLDAIGKCGAA